MHKTFLSYHHANEQDLKDSIIETYGGESFIDKSVSDGDISTDVSEEYIMRKIREEYLADTSYCCAYRERDSPTSICEFRNSGISMGRKSSGIDRCRQR